MINSRQIIPIIIAELSAALLLLNLIIWQSPIIGNLALFVYIIALILVLNNGSELLTQKWFILYELLVISSFWMALGAIIYFFYRIDQWSLGFLLFLTPLVVWRFQSWLFIKLPDQTTETDIKIGWHTLSAILIFFLLIGRLIMLLVLARTDISLKTPFSQLSIEFFIEYFLTALLLLHLFKKIPWLWKLMLSSCFFFISFAVGAIIYKVGFGFDPFIHQATEKLIAAQGLVTPKPVYYLGQYFLIVSIHKLTLIPIELIDRWLLPALAAIFVPYTNLLLAKQSPNLFSQIAPLFLILPFSYFTLTTPWGLASLLLIITVLAALNPALPKIGPILTGLASLLTHPLAGIGALIFLIWHHRKKLNWLILGFSLFLIPGLFSLNSLINRNQIVTFNWPNWYVTAAKTVIYDPIYSFAYFWHGAVYWLVITGAVGATIIIYKFQRKNFDKFIPVVATFFILQICSFILSAFFQFPFLIEYERADFYQRLFIASFWLIMPLFIYFYQVTFQNQFTSTIFGTVFFSLMILNSLYFSYPRDNQFFPGRQISTSTSDQEVVRLIEKRASGPYIVLANQSVSAAAVAELGFKKYFKTPNGEIYFYSIPTGGPLYQHYLKMVYDRPSRQTMKEAAELAQVKEAYWVINNYWSNYSSLAETAKAEADQWWLINNSVQVFKYTF